MPSESAGKTVTSIKKYKTCVHVSFNDNKEYRLSYDTFESFLLYKGKTLSEKEYKKLLKDNRLSDIYTLLVKKCSKRLYSEWDIRSYLKETYLLDNENINYLIKKLKDNDFINDLRMGRAYQDYYNLKNLGKREIEKKLYEKGLFKETIIQLSFPLEVELEKAQREAIKVSERYKNLPEKAYLDKIKSHLYQKGFDSGVIKAALSNISYSFNEGAKEKLKKEFNHYYNKYLDKYNGYELKKRVNDALIRKGYKYEQINQCWREKDVNQ